MGIPIALRLRVGLAALIIASVVGLFAPSASADVTSVGGGAFGVFADPQNGPSLEPTPTVVLPPGGAEPPIEGSADGVSFNPTGVFPVNTGPIRVQVFGRLGANGFVANQATVDDVDLLLEVIEAKSVESACDADPANGIGALSHFDQSGTAWDVALPINPAPNTVITHTGDQPGEVVGRVILNEQVLDKDGLGITVNAIHAQFEVFGGRRLGDVIIAQSRCSVSTKPAPGALRGNGRKCRAGDLPQPRFPRGQPCGPGPGQD